MGSRAWFAACVLAAAAVVAAPTREDTRVYRGEHLDAVAMPIGGIGTGSVWLAGDGRLGVWQIFNNNDERPLADTFLAVRIGGERPTVRVLQRGAGWGMPGFADVACVGEYPLLRIRYADAELPIAVELEGLNPLIPTSTKDSALPCAIFRLTARNRSDRAVDAAFLLSLQNPLGILGGTTAASRGDPRFGGNQNAYREVPGGGVMQLGTAAAPGARMERDIRLFVSGRSERAVLHCAGVEVAGLTRGAVPDVDAVWLEGLTGREKAPVWQLLAAAARDGKVVVLSGADAAFFEQLAALQRQGGEAARPDHDVFEDFERGTYDGWTIEGTAFGKAPHTGTSAGQQHVSGFWGRRLVNTYLPGDEPHGRLVSRPFRIERRFIGFLIGGGAHRGRTCVNLLVDGKVVRTQTGKNLELLEPAEWDVADLAGQEVRLEIVDAASSGWGHINVDRIVFSDTSPRAILAPVTALKDIVPFLAARIEDVREIDIEEELAPPFAGAEGSWKVRRTVALTMREHEGYRLVCGRGGVPLLVSGPFGKGRIVIALARGLPASWGMAAIAEALGTSYRHGEGIERDSRLWGELVVAGIGGEVTGCARWTEAAALWRDFADDGRLAGPAASPASPAGETFNAALSVALALGPGEEKTASFVLTWFFPNVERFGHRGNRYAGWFAGAAEANAYVRENLARLVADTHLYHDTMYETNLPYLAVDAITSQSVVVRGPTCWWAAEHKEIGKDYFAGFEGAYGSCPLNCTHVWNYAQAHARLFPEIGRQLRWYDFQHYLREDGETQHRQHRPSDAFVDGQCAVIEGACREYLLSPDTTFLEEIYPRVKRAVEWLVRKIDPDEDGVNGGEQWNTYDVATNGAHTFVGSQYLSALAAAEKMALVVKDGEAAARWRTIRERGSKHQDERLFNGEYFLQIPEARPARDYNTGCHSDQLVGQWWSHMLDNGYLYPAEHVRTALRSIFRHNFREHFRGFEQRPRRYVLDDEGGLLLCSWPRGGRPDPFILYADEIWTGIEYEVAGLMIHEGLVDEGLKIIETARRRYDGRVREGLNSGPGGNPFNELECGKFYARAMSSWGILLASQGFLYEGPRGVLGFRPRWKPEDHASFFVCAEGWGLFRQQRAGRTQTETIECRWGQIALRELVFQTPGKAEVGSLKRNGQPRAA
ncbi:MAG: hypothetical protein JXQ29_08430, partial [Planctomycetes bacterium]|nr:hypothetical protein [Planctomycetota bacterium]